MKSLLIIFVVKLVFALKLDQGELIGTISSDRKGNEFKSFMSIPYAQPPINKLRFTNPQEALPWLGVLNATRYSQVCKQMSFGEYIGDEDCLYLNVFTRIIESCETNLKPVVVFFHGGAFLHGSSSLYGPKFLMAEDIVLVTVNYRLGIFGFATSKDGKVSGNFGLKDQNMALRWIQKNIQKFCGDPEKVTIMGQSAGGASVHFHVLSPMSRGLFSKAISMSSFSENLWVRGKRGSFEFLAEKMGLLKNTTEETLSILRETSSESILQSLYTDLILPIHEPYLYGIIIDGEFVVDEPMDLIRSGKYNKVPYFFGYTNKEGIIYHVFNIFSTGKLFVLTDFKEMLPKDLDMNVGELKDAIINFYFNGEEPSENNSEKFVDLASDLWFRLGSEEVIKAHADNGDVLYYYRFSADSKMNTFKRLTNLTAAFPGASHEDDIRYLFDNALTPDLEAGSREDVLIDKVIGYFVNFIKFGKPSDNWPRVTNDQMFFCDIDDNLVCGKNPDRNRLDFWNNLYKKHAFKKPCGNGPSTEDATTTSVIRRRNRFTRSTETVE